MMLKKTLSLLAVLCLGLCATACVYRSNQEYYEQAQLYLGSGDYDTAADLFSQLGEYADSADYALYAAALGAICEEEYDLARANLRELGAFKSSARYLRYIDALEYEKNGEPEAALAVYESLGSFARSDLDAVRLRTEIPEKAICNARSLMAKGEYAAARELLLALNGYGQSATLAQNCLTAMNRAAYTAADRLCDEGDHLAAMQAFQALGDVLDAPARAEQCRAAILLALNTAAADATLDTAAELIAAYEAVGDPEADAQAAALTERFGVNLQLIHAADSRPYVLLGEYPMGESGLESALLWRVIAVKGAEVTLLCDAVIDASPIATGSDLMLTEAERAAMGAPTLPSAADLASLSDLSCTATPYAVAQGVAQEGGYALYWLRDSLENGIHPVVSSSGTLSIPGSEVMPGLRPMVTLSLEDYAFTAGDGTRENPFR